MNQTINAMTIIDSAKYDGIYAAIADNVKEISRTKIVFKTDAHIAAGEFEANFPEGMKEIYTCRACSEFFSKYGGLVYLDDKGVQQSALFNGITSKSSHIQYAVDSLKQKAKDAKIIGVFVPQKSAMGTTGFRVGLKDAGGWPHFYLDMSLSYRPRNANYTNLLQALNTLSKAYGLKNLADYAKSFAQKVDACLDIPLPRRESANKFAKALQAILNAKTMFRVTHAMALNITISKALTNPDLAEQLATIYGFKGSVMGAALDDFIHGRDFKNIRKSIADRTSVENYRVKDTSAISESAIRQAAQRFENMGLMPSLNCRLAKVNDLPSIWRKAPVHVAGGSNEFNPFKDAIASKAKRTPEVTEVHSPRKVSLDKFLSTILPTARSLLMQADRSNSVWRFTVPVEEGTKPIFVWDTESDRRPYCTQVCNEALSHSHIPIKIIDGRRYYEVMAVVETPWTFGVGESRMPGANPTWVGVTTAATNETQRSPVDSFGQALMSTLYPYRAAIDAALKHTRVQIDGEYAIGLSFGVGDTSIDVFVDDGDTNQRYTIVCDLM